MIDPPGIHTIFIQSKIVFWWAITWKLGMEHRLMMERADKML